MVDVLLTRPFSRPWSEDLADRLRAVDPRVRVRQASEPLCQLLAGTLTGDAAVVVAARREAAELLPPVEAIIGFGHYAAAILDQAPRLRWIQTTGAGLDRIDPRVLERVTVTNAAGVAAAPVSEHVVCLLLMLARGAHVYMRRQLERRWERGVPAREVAGLTMGIIGMGTIGSAVAHRARALGLRVLGVRRSVERRAPDLVADEVFPPGDLPIVLAESDVVVVAAPLTPETRGLIGERELRTMRPGAYLINIARGPVIDEPALIRALADGHLAGAGLDVFAAEPLPADSPLWDMPNVIITPHVAWNSTREMERLEDLVRDNLHRYVTGQPLRNIVPPGRGY